MDTFLQLRDPSSIPGCLFIYCINNSEWNIGSINFAKYCKWRGFGFPDGRISEWVSEWVWWWGRGRGGDGDGDGERRRDGVRCVCWLVGREWSREVRESESTRWPRSMCLGPAGCLEKEGHQVRGPGSAYWLTCRTVLGRAQFGVCHHAQRMSFLLSARRKCQTTAAAYTGLQWWWWLYWGFGPCTQAPSTGHSESVVWIRASNCQFAPSRTSCTRWPQVTRKCINEQRIKEPPAIQQPPPSCIYEPLTSSATCAKTLAKNTFAGRNHLLEMLLSFWLASLACLILLLL